MWCITNSNGNPNVFNLEHNDDGLWLNNNWTNPDKTWNPENLFVKHKLKIRHYLRYADDFIILSEDKLYLQNLISKISEFLEKKLKLNLHPDKLFIKTLYSGVDFLGWVHFPHHRVLRTATKRRIFKKITKESEASYMGLLNHGNTYKMRKRILDMI